jgi:hypothetical protein
VYLSVEDTFQFLDRIPNGNLIEFGVYTGNYLNRIINGAEDCGNPFENVYGFDSWVGLPKENNKVWHHPDWPEGAFSLCKDFNLSNVEEAIQYVRDRVKRKDINLISGFFETSLTEEIGNKLHDSASYIHIDVDIYSSTVEVLDFIFTYNIAKNLCLFRYDDWCGTPEYHGGNSLAHLEAQAKYPVMFNRIATNVFQLIKEQRED